MTTHHNLANIMFDHDDDQEETTPRPVTTSQKLLKVGGGLIVLLLVSSVVALGSVRPAYSQFIAGKSSETTEAQSDYSIALDDINLTETSSKDRELQLSCVTDAQCPKLDCPSLPCNAFYCDTVTRQCIFTTRTEAPGSSSTTTTMVPTSITDTMGGGGGTLSSLFESNSTDTNTTNTTLAPSTTTPITTLTNPPTTAVPLTSIPFIPPITNAPTTIAPTTIPPATSQSQYTFANNDRCTSAIGLDSKLTPEGMGPARFQRTPGTSLGASYDVTAGAPVCGNNIRYDSPGVWYKIVGTGDRMTASTCWPGTNYDTAISIYASSRRRNNYGERRGLKGERGLRRALKEDEDEEEDDSNNNSGASGAGCSALQCVNANDDNGAFCAVSSTFSRVQWDSVRGRTYWILVHGFAGRQGNFELSVINARPLNERCDEAVELPIGGDTIIGTTYQANLPWGENQATNCGGRFGLIGDTSSVWYKVRSPFTQTLEVSTCHPLTDFDTKLHIFEGSCSSNGSCIGGNDNWNSPQRCSLHRWTANAGTDYYILVHAMLTDNGLFELSLRAV